MNTLAQEMTPKLELFEAETMGRLDTPEEIRVLEEQAYARDYIEAWLAPDELHLRERSLAPLSDTPKHYVEYINNQFLKKIMPTFLAEDEKKAWEAFSTTPQHTLSEEMLLLLNEQEFIELRVGLKEYLDHTTDDRETSLQQRLERSGDISWNDRYQFANKEKRSLEQIRENGIQIELNPEAVAEIKLAAEDNENHRPLLERVKNLKLATINGFADSKFSLLVHDYMDHYWSFDKMGELGMLDKFSNLFDKIGNPEKTDIFKREGEAISSIAFGIRLFNTVEVGFNPLISTDDISKKMDEMFIDGELSDRHMDALRIIKSMKPNTREWLSLGFVFSNYAVELDEQRRKHGKIKTRDLDTGEIDGELNIFDPDYISLFIELHHVLLDPSNKHRDNLYKVHLVLEDILQGVSRTPEGDSASFTINTDVVDSYNFDEVLISGETMKWMLTNYGFTATKETMV
jgi:hypothetical protein